MFQSRTDESNRVRQTIPGIQGFSEDVRVDINVGKARGERSGKSKFNSIQLLPKVKEVDTEAPQPKASK